MQYLNTKAKNAFLSEKLAVIIIAGRGFGKSDYIGAEILDCAQKMPRSLGSLWGLTFSQILTKILPSAKKKIMSFGLKEDRPGSPGHFVIGRKPPDYFKRPINEPLRWDNVLTLWTGSAIEFISVDRPELIAGGSYDYMIFDEAVYFPKDIHDTKAIPSLRGNRQFFQNCAKHGRRVYVSSQSWDPAGYWVEDQKLLKDEEGEVMRDENQKPLLDPEIDFFHGSSYDNIRVLGPRTLALWKKTLPKIVYDIEIMAQRQGKISNAYYENFEKFKHTYMRAIEYGRDLEKSEFGTYVKKKDADRITNLPLILGLDFGTSFNSMVVSQHIPELNEMRSIKEFFESSNKLLENLIDPFINYYENHEKKLIYLYGDPSGNKVGHMEKLSLFAQIEQRLEAAGWTVQNKMKGRAYPLHKVKHQFLNRLLSEAAEDLPKVRINLFACRYLLTSMQNAPLDKSLGKDKKSERQKIPQQTATHLSDAWDYSHYYYLKDRQTKPSSSRGGIRIGRR